MRTFPPKAKGSQQTTSTQSAKPGRSFFGQSCEVKSILDLFRTIGNQAVKHLSGINTRDTEENSTATSTVRFGHDFSRIPVTPSNPGVIQSKLTINTPQDRYEQEADRVAEQIMRKEIPSAQGTSVHDEYCRSCQPQKLYSKSLQAKGSGESVVPPIVKDVLRDTAQPLDAPTKAFVEPRFGYDFSSVQVHIGGKAPESASALDARAYTVGQNIVFGANQYAPGTDSGRRLLAHELTHVVQQTGIGSQPPGLQRASFGSDGRLSPAHQAIVRSAASVADRMLRARGPISFRRLWDAFWQNEGRTMTPKPTFDQYKTAVENRIIHDMDTSTDSEVRQHKEDDSDLPLELQTAAVTRINNRNTYIRQFAIEQGIDSVVSLILHESFHGTGLPEGPLSLYEPSLHSFEASVGFPMMMGGGDVMNIQQERRGDYHENVTINYQLRQIDEDLELPEHLEVQVTDEYGTIVSQEEADGNRAEVRHRIPSRVGRGNWVWHARYPSAITYSVRIVNATDRTLMAAKRIEVNPRCIIGVSSIHCDD